MIISTMNYTFTPGPGQYNAFGPDGPFPAWCAEKEQYLSFGEPIEYTFVDGVDAWGIAMSHTLDQLMSFASTPGWLDTATKSAAVQNDIWGILAGHTGKLDVSGTPITVHASQLHNPTRQDLLVTQAVPEPGLLALLGIGLLLVWRFSREKGEVRTTVV